MPSGDELPNFYGLLEVSVTASSEEIEAAYTRIQETLGGNGLALYSIIENEDADSFISRVDSAYQTLIDPDSRDVYDASLRENEGYPSLSVHRREVIVETQTSSETSAGEAPVLGRSLDRLPVRTPRSLTVKAQLNEFDLGPDTEFSGALLKRIRESANASLREIAEITKIGRGYLKAIETNDFNNLPAPVYVRGFVAEYARVLGLDPNHVAPSFMALYARYREGGS